LSCASAVLFHSTPVPAISTLFPYPTLFRSITTRGFRDALEIGRMRYPRLYDLTWMKPPPLVERRRRREVVERLDRDGCVVERLEDRKSTRLNSSHGSISYAVFCLKKKRKRI